MCTVLDALQRAVDHYPGGRVAVASRLRKTDEVLRKELGGGATHKLGVVDALAIARYCVDAGKDFAHDFAQTVASECGGRFELGATVASDSHGPMHRVSLLMRETSDVASSVIDALADGVVSDNELKQIEREVEQAEQVLRALRQAARANNLGSKPAALRAA